MQFLMINRKDTMLDIGRIVGQNNVDLVLAENSLSHSPRVGAEWYKKCADFLAQDPPYVTASRKAALLNHLTGSEEAFEKACLMDEDEWKVFSAFQAFPDAIRVPESISLPYSTKVIGDVLIGSTTSSIGGVAGRMPNNAAEPVNPVTYQAVMTSLKYTPVIDPKIFNTVNTNPPAVEAGPGLPQARSYHYAYNIPWGKIQMYSTNLKETIDFPAYPEEIEITRRANYTAMPNIIYQYEPWVVYESSGPREQPLSFHLHRDMWTGNHLDGNANKLIRFCESNTFANYSGSAVLPPLIRFYIDGSLFISGVLTNTSVTWTGPLGLDNWYLEFTLSLMIQEISERTLSTKTVSKFGLKGT